MLLDRIFDCYVTVLGKKIIAILITLSLLDGTLWMVKHIFNFVLASLKYVFP